MGNLLFIFKLIISPVKTIYRLMTGKKKETHFLLKPLKLCLIVILIIFSIGTIIAAFNEADLFIGTWRENGTSIVPVEVDLTQIDDELLQENPDGTMNGLNLQLIDTIKTEGYVKEYLTLARKNYLGQMNNYENRISVGSVIATSISESGFYPGTPLPISYLPWDSSSNSVVWNKSINGLPAEALTLSKLNKNVISQSLLGAYGPVTPYSGALTVGDSGGENSVTPFQINVYQNTINQPIGWKSNMDGYKSEGRTTTDITYFPDQLTYLNTRFDSIKQYADLSRLTTEEEKVLMYSLCYNPGIGNAQKDEFGGASFGSDEMYESLKILYEDLTTVYEKYGPVWGNMNSYQTRSFHAYILLALVKECGWKFKSGDSYIMGDAKEAWNYYNWGGTLQDFVNSNSVSMPAIRTLIGGRTSPAVTVTKNGRTINSDGIALAQAMVKVYLGNIVYGRMLQYAGVNVDPTDPNTYMNTLPEGEWKPGGDSVWMNNYPEIDKTKLNSKREAFLNEAYKWLGSWYVYGGNSVPLKDSNGNWIDGNKVGTMNGFDCSFLIQYSAKQTLGIDITRSTYSQVSSGMIEQISKSEMKPGDLVYCYQGSSPEHVYIYLGTTSDGYDLILHAPSTGKTVEIRVMNYPSYYSGGFKYYRIKGIDS